MKLNTTNDNSFCTKVQFQFPISRVFWFFRVLFLKLVLVLLFPLSLYFVKIMQFSLSAFC